MAGPSLTPDEIAQMKKEQTKALTAAETFTAQIAGQQARAAELAKVDSAFKKFFDYYNSDIIGKYDSEKRALNGIYVVNPISEADIQNVGNVLGGRLQPDLPQTDIVRVPEFDGGGTSTDPQNETQYITNQASVEDALVNGYGGSTPSGVTTSTALTPTSTSMNLTGTGLISIAPNSVFVITDGTTLAVVKILTINVTPATPPATGSTATTTIEYLVTPSSTIAAGQNLTAFNGFSNAERASKTSSNPQLQGLMSYLVGQLQTYVNGRITNLNTQLTAISTNLDPDGTAAFAQATTNANTSKTFLTNYVATTDISDTGLSSLSTERGVRLPQITARVAQINSAYTGQTINYYNERYSAANNRGNTSRGSLRLQKAAEQSSATAVSFAATLTAQATAIGSILP